MMVYGGKMADKGRIIAFVDDMFFVAKIRAAAQAGGCEVESVRSLERLEKAIADSTSLVIVDLNSDRLNPIQTIETLKSSPATKGIPIVGFLSHVQVDLKQAAERTGCDYVIPRSMFSMKLAEIVSGDLSSLPLNPTHLPK
jgi:CheY-like chemotaxis protein